MRPAARLQAAIDLLDQIIAAARDAGPAADTLIARYFKNRRYAGSKDRRAIRDLVYRAIRRSGERPLSGRAALVGLAQDDAELLAYFDGSEHGPAPVDGTEAVAGASIAPAWLRGRFDPLMGDAEIEALLGRAPLDLRINRLKGSVKEALAAFPEAAPTRLSPLGLRLPEGFQVEESEAWQSGLVEVQDEGSQLLSLACEASSDMVVIDLCAGAGGKTLAVAAEMGNAGRIFASDTDRGRLSRLPQRLHRAGVTIVDTILLDPGREFEALSDLEGGADIVLIDAPCSGTGTWRRNPETRWRLAPDRLDQLIALQTRLLDLGSQLVRPGGHLVYAVCSLLSGEGREQAAAFGASHSSWVPAPISIAGGRAAGTGRLLTPAQDGTDGFFVARWQAPC